MFNIQRFVRRLKKDKNGFFFLVYIYGICSCDCFSCNNGFKNGSINFDGQHSKIKTPTQPCKAFCSRQGKNNSIALTSFKIKNRQRHLFRYNLNMKGKVGIEENWDSLETKGEETGFSVEKAILALALPAFAGLAIDPLMTLVDTAFIGKYSSSSAAALAGVGSASALLTFFFYLFNFLTTATTPLVSSRRALGDVEGASVISGQSLSLALVLGIGLFIFLLVNSDFLLYDLMGVGSSSFMYAHSFLTVRAFAAPAVFICGAATGILRGFFDTETPLVVLTAANAVNLLLDIILIFYVKMDGPTGAAIATTTAEWISALSYIFILSGYLPSASSVSPLGSSSNIDSKSYRVIISPLLEVPSWKEVQPLLEASSSAFIRSLALQITLSGAMAVAARDPSASQDIVAAHQIAIQLWLLCSFVCDALAAASQTLVADAISRENRFEVKKICFSVFSFAAILGISLALSLYSLNHFGILVSLFTDDKIIQNYLAPIMPIIIWSQPLNTFVFCADGVLQGATEFFYQAKSVVFSAVVSVVAFFFLEWHSYESAEEGLLLQHIWQALTVLIFCRGVTSFLKLTDANGSIDLFSKKT